MIFLTFVLEKLTGLYMVEMVSLMAYRHDPSRVVASQGVKGIGTVLRRYHVMDLYYSTVLPLDLFDALCKCLSKRNTSLSFFVVHTMSLSLVHFSGINRYVWLCCLVIAFVYIVCVCDKDSFSYF